MAPRPRSQGRRWGSAQGMTGAGAGGQCWLKWCLRLRCTELCDRLRHSLRHKNRTQQMQQPTFTEPRAVEATGRDQVPRWLQNSIAESASTPHCAASWTCFSPNASHCHVRRSGEAHRQWSALSMKELQASLQAVSHTINRLFSPNHVLPCESLVVFDCTQTDLA